MILSIVGETKSDPRAAQINSKKLQKCCGVCYFCASYLFNTSQKIKFTSCLQAMHLVYFSAFTEYCNFIRRRQGEDVNRVVVGVKLSQKFYLTNGVIGRCNMHSTIHKREWGFDPQMFIKFSFYWKQDGSKGTTTTNSFNWRMMETDTHK